MILRRRIRPPARGCRYETAGIQCIQVVGLEFHGRPESTGPKIALPRPARGLRSPRELMTDQTNHQSNGQSNGQSDGPPIAQSGRRFKAEMPQIPGVGGAGAKTTGPSGRLLILVGVAAVLIAIVVGVKLFSKPRRAGTPAAQIDVPASAPDLTPSLPPATEHIPGIARVGDLAKPWDSIQFTFRDPTSGENVSGFLVRLPTGSPNQTSGYWSFATRSAFGNCQMEFVRDIEKLRNDYGYSQAKHPMAGNPCSRSLFDPLKYGSIPGNALARGAIAQGSDLRPPLGIDIEIRGRDIFAVRME